MSWITSTGFSHLVFVVCSTQSTAIIETALSDEAFAIRFNVQDRVCTVSLTLQRWLIPNIRCISVLTGEQWLDVFWVLFNFKTIEGLSISLQSCIFHYISKQTVLSTQVSLKLCKTWAGLTSNFTSSDRLSLCMFSDAFVTCMFLHFQHLE